MDQIEKSGHGFSNFEGGYIKWDGFEYKVIQKIDIVHNIDKEIDYHSIQAAIDDASLGDEIHVDSSTYYEHVDLNKNLILKGIDSGAGMPIVDAGGSGSAITLSADGVMLEGFTATNSGPADIFAGSNIDAGIKLLSSNNIIKNNKVLNCQWGIYLYWSHNNKLSDNTVLDQNALSSYYKNGIFLRRSFNNEISGNVVSKNDDLFGTGISLYNSRGNRLIKNDLTNNNEGIEIVWSDVNTIINNNISNNRLGIRLSASNNNILYHNNLVNNSCNAIDYYDWAHPGTNMWDSGWDGNYYSNFTGDDLNADGRIDTPYLIPGGSSVDRYPLMVPYSSSNVLPRFNAGIISPKDGSIFFDYENISFEGTSSYGFEPLNYSWIISVSGFEKYLYEINDIPTEYYSNEQSFNQTLEGGSWLVYFKIKDDNGRVVDNYHNIVVLGPFLELNAGVKYNRINETINISAYAFNPHLGEDVTSGVAKFDILDINNVTTGITGDLSYNSDSGYWEVENFYVPNLEDGNYKVHIFLNDSTGYGAIDNPFLKMDGNGVVQGYLLNGPQSTDTKIITIPETEVSLYSSYNYFLEKDPVAVTTTDTNGKFEFNDVEPGFYVLNSTIPNQNMEGVSDSFRVGNTIALQDLTLFYIADIFNSEIKELKEKYIKVMDYETKIISEISQRYHDDIDEDPSYLSYMLSVVGASVEVALSEGIDNEVVFLYDVLVIKQIPFMGYLGINELASDLLNDKYGYTFSEIKSNHDQHYVSINQDYDNYIKEFKEIEVSNDFDTIGAKGLLTNLNYQLSLVSNEDTKFRMIIPFSPSEKDTVLNLPQSNKLYIDTAIAKNEFENVELFNQFVLTSGKIFLCVYANDNVIPTPIVSVPLDVFETYVEVETVKIKTSFKSSLARIGVILVGSWNNDMNRIENSYKNNIEFLIKEMENPKYLNKNNKFDLEVDIISQPPNLIESEDINIPILSNLWASGQVDKEMELNIKNIGNVDSIVRVSWNGKWEYDPKIIGKISSDEKSTFETAIGSSKQELAPNEVGSFTIPYSGLYQAESFLGTGGPNPHSLTVMAFSGPFQKYSHTFFYVVTDPELNLTSSRTESGILTVEKLSEYTPKISTIISDELTINNPTTTANFKTSDDTQTLMLMMDSFIGIPIELHVYDSSGKHVGYDVNTDKIAIEFPASYYGEIYNPEKIIIPNAGNKSFTIIARLPYLYDQIESSVEVYALENPRRPPILSVSNMHINKLVGNNQTVLIDLSIAESGGQHQIHNVNATITNITKDGIELPLLSPQKIIIGDLPAGSTGIATFVLDIPVTIPDGNYTGIINVDSGIGPYPVNVTIQITSKPDLNILFINVNKTVWGGDNTNLTVFAENLGFTNVANTKLELLVDDVQIESRVLEIPSECLEVHTFNWTAVTGNHIIKARIDSDNTTEEFNENNNEFEMPIIVNSVADIDPPSSITNFHSTNNTTWINWTWINPLDPDFNHSEIYLNGTFQTPTSAEFFNATGLIPNTEYEISTKTADNLGNINETWVNHTAMTLDTPPVANASGPYTGIEGQAIIFNASASYDTDPGDNIVSFEWDFNNDGATDTTGMEATWTWNDDYAGQVNLTVTDSHGESSTETTSVTILNAPPEVEAGNDQTVNEGDTVSFIGDFTDPGTGDTHTIEWDFGDGTPGSTGTLEPIHVYADNGTYTVTLTVTDDDGASTSDTLNMTVENVAPIVDAGVDQTANEGDIVSFVGNFTDPGTADTHLIEWDFGDGTQISLGILATTHVYADNGTYAVKLTVTDDDGASTSDTLIVTVNNVAPVLDEYADQTVQWGDTMTVSRSFTDPGDDSWTAEIDWGDGSQEEGILSSKIITATHVYSIPGEYIYTLTVQDDDGGVGSGDMQITVTTRATELEYIGDLSAQYSDYINLEAQLNDPGNNNPLPDRSINFILGSQTATATTGPDGIATTSFKLDQPAGSYDIKAEFAGDDSYSPDNDTKVMQISREDAEITYTGDTILPTTAGSIDLRATLEEIDTDYGDLTEINVNFNIYKSSDLSYSNPVATIPSVASISVTSSGMGVGTATATIDNLPEDDYMIIARIVPNNYYLPISSNPTPMIVYEPTEQFTTGGGWIWDPTGSHGNFGFNVKYNKKGKVKGNSIYVYRLDKLDYIVKSNACIGLAINDNTSTFQGKAVLQIFDPVTGELQPESSGNFQFTIEAMDNELNGNPDHYEITVLDKDGLEYHNATGSLEGGNIVIHDKKSK